MDSSGAKNHGKKWMPAMYVVYFGLLQQIFNKNGYALCVHGSIMKDFDLVAIPFDHKISPHDKVLTEVKEMVGLSKQEVVGYRMTGLEPHGRMCYAIECGGGGYFDISFTPTIQQITDLIKKEKKQKSEMKRLLAKTK